MRLSRKLISLAAIFLILALSLTSLFHGTTFADDGKGQKLDEYTTRVVDKTGKTVDREIYPKKPPDILPAEPKVTLPNATATSGMSRDVALATNSLSNVPAFTWCYGCSATAAAMLAGYYDQPEKGYVNIYTGPANGGVCPLNNVTAWGYQYYGNLCGQGDVTCGFSPLAATKNGLDGRVTRGHVDDYWNAYYCTGDPYNGNWTQHSYDSLGDYMGTSQYYNWNNADGSTTFFNNTDNSPLYDYSGAEPTYRDGCHGIRLFLESKGYTVTSNYNQRIYGYNGVSAGFTYAQYKAEIDAGRPVIIQLYGHSMLGVGYSDPSTVYIHNTWSNSATSMTWGQPYSGMAHRGVTVIQLTALPTTPTITNSGGATNTTTTSATLNGNLTSTGGQTTTVNVYWGTTDGGTTPGSWTNNVSLGTWSAGAFSTGISGLTPYATYYYRCAATNASGTSWAGSSASFVAATPIRLIGANDVAASGNHGANYLGFTKWTATASGSLNQVRVKCGIAGNVKVALYADSAGAPGALLAANNTGQAVVSGWNTIYLTSSAAVTSGTTYWLAMNSDTACVNFLSGTGTLAYRIATYSGSFPDPAGIGFTTGSYYSISQGWGTP